MVDAESLCIFDWDEASGRSHHVGYAPESDLIAASPRNDATCQLLP